MKGYISTRFYTAATLEVDLEPASKIETEIVSSDLQEVSVTIQFIQRNE